MTLGLVCLGGALVISTLSARTFSRQRRGTPLSRLLLVVGLGLWIVAAFLLPPVAWLDQLSLSPWLTIPLRVLAAWVVGTAASRLWYALVP